MIQMNAVMQYILLYPDFLRMILISPVSLRLLLRVSDPIVNNEWIVDAMKELIWKRKYKCILHISAPPPPNKPYLGSRFTTPKKAQPPAVSH